MKTKLVPCRRATGTFRKYFYSQKEAEAFEADPRNVDYHGDVAHLCGKCGYWHLSKPEWIAQPGDVLLMNGEYHRLLFRREDGGTLWEKISEKEATQSPPSWLVRAGTPRKDR